MPKNKDALDRYRIIDELVNNTCYPSFQDLWNACEERIGTTFSKSCIEKDIAALKNLFGAPLEHNNKYKGYYYQYPFSMQTTIPLKNEEVTKIQMAFATLQQYQHLNVFQSLEGIFDKISKAVKYKLPNTKHKNYIHFQEIPYAPESHQFDFFLTAIEQEKEVLFQYRSNYHEDTITHKFQPYEIKEYENRWYVVGRQSDSQSIIPFAFDRIQGIPEFTGKLFERDPEFDLESYFENVYGMTVANESVQTVVLQFTSLQAKYFKSKPFHAYETIEEYKNATPRIVKMQLQLNYELTRKIVSMGGDVRVIEPVELKNRVTQYLKKALEQYKQ